MVSAPAFCNPVDSPAPGPRLYSPARGCASDADRDALVADHSGVAGKAARDWARTPGRSEDDARQDGLCGLIAAAEDYDAGTARVPFHVFAAPYVLDAIREGASASRGGVRLPRMTRVEVRACKRAADRLRAETGADPAPRDVLRAAGLSGAAAWRVAGVLNFLAAGWHADAPSVLPGVESPGGDDRGGVLADLDAAVATLDGRERTLVTLVSEGVSFPEAGTAVGLRETQARAVHKAALAKLRAHMGVSCDE